MKTQLLLITVTAAISSYCGVENDTNLQSTSTKDAAKVVSKTSEKSSRLKAKPHFNLFKEKESVVFSIIPETTEDLSDISIKNRANPLLSKQEKLTRWAAETSYVLRGGLLSTIEGKAVFAERIDNQIYIGFEGLFAGADEALGKKNIRTSL